MKEMPSKSIGLGGHISTCGLLLRARGLQDRRAREYDGWNHWLWDSTPAQYWHI